MSALSFDKAIRKVFPSVSSLSFNPAFKIAMNSFDIFPKIMFKEIRKIPPNHLRVRVGVSGRLFHNHIHYLTAAKNFWLYWMEREAIKLDSTILDIGCGCGRFAHHIRDFRFKDKDFRGTYIGVDIDDEALEWCRQNFDKERFRFLLSTDKSVSYRQDSSETNPYQLPEPESSVNFVFSTSLFTHLLEPELVNYLKESHRLLKPGGIAAHYHFSLDYPPPTLGTRHTFSHQMGNSHVESLQQPEAAVAYRQDFLFDLCRRIGFSSCEIVHVKGDWQPMLVCIR